jgi:16S rRNA (cytidine1402-2'-O)-methyltransferase
VLSQEVKEIAATIDEFVVENEKSARKFLKSIGTKIPQNDLILHVLNEHSGNEEIKTLSGILKKNKNIGLLSEAGCPAVADPGAQLVRLAHEQNIKVIPLTGPSSIILSLMASGLNGQSFTFHGYLPRESSQRKMKLAAIEKDSQKKNQTQIFIETPYRNIQLLTDILQTCEPGTRLCIACNITSPDEFIKTRSIAEWKKNIPEINKIPAIFLLGK